MSMSRFSRMTWLLALLLCGGFAFAQEEEAPPAEPAPPAGPPDLRQVQVQVWISETNEQGLRDIGTNLDFNRIVRGVEQSHSVQRVRTQVFDPFNPDFTVTLPAPDPTGENPPLRPDQSGSLADGIQTQSGAGMSFSVISTDRGTIDGVFRSTERTADVDLISKPELLVVNGQSAQINAGGEFPYQSVQYNNQGVPILNVAWENLGVNINLTPLIRTDDLIQIEFTELDVTDIVRVDNIRGIDLPVFSQRKQTGSVLVPNGQALVIGGLSSRVVRRTERRVPIVGALPLVGIPFRGRRAEAGNNHLLIFVSPTVVNLQEMEPRSINALNFWQNREWTNRQRIMREVEALEENL